MTWFPSLIREGRRVLAWPHAVLLGGACLAAYEPFLASAGVSVRDVLYWLRLLAVLIPAGLAPRLVLDDRQHGSLELMAATRTGVAAVFLLRLSALVLWYCAALAVVVWSLAPGASNRLSVYGASVVDALLLASAAAYAAHRTGSEVGGVVAGMTLWAVGAVTKLSPQSGWESMKALTPLSALFEGSDAALMANRAFYGLLAALLLTLQCRILEQPASLLTRQD